MLSIVNGVDSSDEVDNAIKIVNSCSTAIKSLRSSLRSSSTAGTMTILEFFRCLMYTGEMSLLGVIFVPGLLTLTSFVRVYGVPHVSCPLSTPDESLRYIVHKLVC